MTTAAQHLAGHPHVQTIKRYYRACSSGDVVAVAACCTPDVSHYMLQPGHGPVYGAESLGRFWQGLVSEMGAEWQVEHAIASDDEAVIEWSMAWNSRRDGERYIVHGAEWYRFDGELISEIRAYYRQEGPADTGLQGFPYGGRGYTIIDRS
ncbi:MAG TPA: nuclear transport factor 2 family protein, partial [Solirubrobacteraceae bacterium]|nr:nuclear transport factor 2 family protein [Solirubrobacteraceae bacterium]